MEPNQIKTSAKDFFLHLGAIIALYTVFISFLNLIFKIINKAFPEIQNYRYYWGSGSEISMPVATLIIVFPIFIILSWLVYKTYTQNPAKKELNIRKWLIYITLFIAGIILTGDLITILYKFLDGQNLTTVFLLKALIVLLVTGGIFGFYLQDIRNKISSKGKKMWAIVVAVVILISIILGFSVLGSPRSQRLLRYDNQKISNLQMMQRQVINNWQIYGLLPETLLNYPIDPQTKKPYEYRKTGEMTFEVCAKFNQKNMMQEKGIEKMQRNPYLKNEIITQNNNWDHKTGYYCFERKIDSNTYPIRLRKK